MSNATAWQDYYWERSGIAAEMLGAADYFEAHPDYATDARVAKVFREYVARIRAVERPA